MSKNFRFLDCVGFPPSNATLRGSHGLSARRALWMKSSRPEGPPAGGVLDFWYVIFVILFQLTPKTDLHQKHKI